MDIFDAIRAASRLINPDDDELRAALHLVYDETLRMLANCTLTMK